MRPEESATETAPVNDARPFIGTSACLAGDEVRFNGGHAQSRFFMQKMADAVRFIKVCPEVESGMGVPRETVRLVARDRIRVVGSRSGEDHTDRLETWASARVQHLAELPLDGFLLKKDSPSCGVARVKIYAEGANAMPTRDGQGVFAEALQKAMPWLPLCEDGWLADPSLRESFLSCVYTHRRFRNDVLAAPTRNGLMKFHAAHKFLYLAHSPEGYRKLGRICASVASRPLEDVVAEYRLIMMKTLAARATPGKHANVLQHILGYFRNLIPTDDRLEIMGYIESFRSGTHGLSTPLTLLIHHLRRHAQGTWLAEQRYFDPFPETIAVR
ncbi:MAG: DUF523 and DUF1722 domain-containing protein [Deltaproteobacteria bacterium]|nr:DUF523 and DUF1722 domain-containing protein [Deltaproteobacteria bacterium]